MWQLRTRRPTITSTAPSEAHPYEHLFAMLRSDGRWCDDEDQRDGRLEA